MYSSHLLDLPVDAIDVICGFLDVEDVVTLLGTGCAVLRLKVSAVAHVLRCQRSAFSAFPFSLFKLPQLRSLDVSITKHQIGDYPLRLESKQPLPTSPISSLTSLRLSFAQSFQVLDEPDPDLNSLLPHITELHLTEARTVWTTDHLRKLPRTLRKLSLLNSAAFLEMPDYSYNSESGVAIVNLSLLPPSLEEVSLSSFSVGDDSIWESFVWPVGLRKLVFLKFDDSEEFFHHLPTSLEHFEVEALRGYARGFDIPVPLSVLPLSLRVFKLKSDFYSIDLRGHPLPRNIEVWNARTNWESLMIDKKDEDAEKVMIAYLPRSLKKVELGGEEEQARVCNQNAPLMYSFLPLQWMDWNECLMGPEMRLPLTITKLECTFETVEQVMALPASLTHLHIYEILVPLPPETWSFLSSFLHALEVSSSFDSDPKELLTGLFQFPHKNRSDPLPLTKLVLEYPSGFCNDLFGYLPSNLTTLRLFIPPETRDEIVSNTFAQMSFLLPHLKSFGILCYSGEGEKTKKLDVIPYLPRKLASLEISFDRITLDPEHMRLLPCELTFLRMGTFGANAGLGNEYFEHLPKSLTKLLLFSVLKDANADFWAQLPPRIHTINIQPRGPQFHEHSRKYYSSPEWEGTFEF